jgi:hypothetical protein
MNERIKELIAQATKRYEPDWNGAPAYEDFDKEKFAELIVRECADFIDSKFDISPYSGEVSSWADGNELKEHFGVEE